MTTTGFSSATLRSQVRQAGVLRTAVFAWSAFLALVLTAYMIWTGVNRYRLLYDGDATVAEVIYQDASVMKYRFTTRTGVVADGSDDARSYFMPVGTRMPVVYLPSNPSRSLPSNQLNNRWERARVVIGLLLLLAFPRGLKWMWQEGILKGKWSWTRPHDAAREV